MLHEHELEWILGQVDQSQYAVENAATYALYRYFNGDVSKLEDWCRTYVQIYQESPLKASEMPPVSGATTAPQIPLDTAYEDGIIVITQYYTFLGNGLHEQAYSLLSASRQNFRSFDQYVKNTRIAFKTVEIISIQPYYMFVSQQGGQFTPDHSDGKQFVVKIRAWGEGNMSGSVSNGVLQILFLDLVQEDGKWKIDSFATAPFPVSTPTDP